MEIVKKITATLFLLIFVCFGKAYAQSLTLGMNATIPLKSSSLELTCRFSELFVSNAIIIRKGSQEVAKCLPGTFITCKVYKAEHNFTSYQTGVFGIIKNLSREADGIWSCRYVDPAISLDVNSNPLNITVYTIPSGLNFTQVPNMNVDLGVTSAQLQCTTFACTYPSPLMQWLMQVQSASSPYEVYKTLNPTGTVGPCVLPEQLYTSTLDLQQNTTLSDNSDKMFTFSCRIEYPGSNINLIASGSQTIRFAVRVKEAFLQYNNQNITSTLTVTAGEQITLTCVTGTSRPAPNVGWYIRSQLIGSGTNLIFTPSNTDNSEVIFCQAYNTDPDLKVDSNKPSLFVRVRVTEAFLQHDNQNITSILTVTAGEQITLTCVTGTSRPAPNIGWYNGSQSIGSGTSLIFTPSNTDHNAVIFCLAYNIDPNLIVYSNKPNLFVRVYVTSIILEGSTVGMIVFTEGYPRRLKCISSPSRPMPIIRWFLGNKQVTDNITNSDVIDTDEMHVLTSEITLVVMRNSSNQKVYCEGFTSGQVTTAISTQVIVDVWYAPVVKVNIPVLTEVGSTAVLMCTPQGNPPQYTFHQWIHMVGQTEIRRSAGVNRFNISTLTLPNISMQDMGTYICTVDNAVVDLTGQINQTGYTHVYVQGHPVIGDKISTFTGEANKSSSIQIPFYSNPSIRTVKFIKQLDSVEISNTSDISIYIQPSNITMMFYKKIVTIPGHVAVLYFRNVKDTDFDNYTLQLSNDQGTVSVQFDLIPLAPPSMPKKFFLSHTEGSFLVFGVEKGFNGGHEQIFVVEYQPFGIPEATWSTVLKISETDLDDPFSNGTYFIKIPKIQDGQYVFRIYAENRKGNSSAIEGVYVELKTELPSPVIRDFQVGAVVGGVVGGIVVVIAIVVVAFVIKRRTIKPKMEETKRRVSLGSKGPEYINTAFRSDFNTTEYEALQSDQTGLNQYKALNDPKSKLNQSTDIRNSSDPRPSAGEMLYDKLQPCDTNQGHMYTSLSSPRLDEGENKIYENTVMSTR